MIRQDIQQIIIEKFNNFDQNNAEDIFLLIDVLTCPYVASTDVETTNFRRQILDKISFLILELVLLIRMLKLNKYHNILLHGFIVGKITT
ncbi:hypothetical protein NV63_06440 [Elizabethkingia anophelis]|nr:hypothetical protein NV63_06440 [Elizabethkingia anophelis]